jgi:hypothetical protein
MLGTIVEDKLSMSRDRTILVSTFILLLFVNSRETRSYLSILLNGGGLWLKHESDRR